MSRFRLLIHVSVLLLAALPIRAELVWLANFESYDAKSGPAPLRIASTGAADTFSGTTASAATLGESHCHVTAGATGNALSLSATGNGTAGTVTLRVIQSTLSGLAEGGVLVVSFDVTLTGKIGFSLANEARAAKGRSGKGVFLPMGREITTPQRAVVVINNSGGPLPLPGSLGELPNNSLASYLYDGSTYRELLLSSGDVLTLPITGFCSGLSKSKLDAGATLAASFDNFGAWTSASDTYQNASVLSLAPGTVVSKP